MDNASCPICGRGFRSEHAVTAHRVKSDRCFVSTEERFWAKVDKDGPNGCWVWLGSKMRGYGGFRRHGGDRHERAHRVAYELLVGPIPVGLTIDHLCRNHSCVNPAHLEPVTPRVNVLRGDTITAANARKTHCIRGHELIGDNLYSYTKANGRPARGCRTCKAAQYHAEARIPRLRPRRSDQDEVCANGHPRSEANTYRLVRRGGVTVTCRVCNREAAARSKARKGGVTSRL